MAKLKRRTRLLGGLTFECYEPGHWLAAEGRLALLHLMKGSTFSEWHLFRTRPGKLPRKPFEAGAAFWGWDDLTYTLTMFEMDKTVRELREKSRAMLPRLCAGETIVRCGRELRLVIGVHLDGDGIGAVLDVESSYVAAADEQWSTYGCSIATFPESYPKWVRPKRDEN